MSECTGILSKSAFEKSLQFSLYYEEDPIVRLLFHYDYTKIVKSLTARRYFM